MGEDRLIGAKINKDGYGIIPKSVMQDRNLSIAAKALYAYFCSFAGQGDCCFPTRKKICNDLDISNDSLGKYINQLVSEGYLTVEQVKENGRFSHNVYTLPDTKLPCPKISDTENSDTENSDTKNNNSKNNNISKNNNNTHIYKAVLERLNEKAGTAFRATTKGTQSVINARLRDGFSLDDFFTVIDKKCAEWIGTDMEKYLRPETLFGNKFEGYLNAKNAPKCNGTHEKQRYGTFDPTEAFDRALERTYGKK